MLHYFFTTSESIHIAVVGGIRFVLSDFHHTFIESHFDNHVIVLKYSEMCSNGHVKGMHVWSSILLMVCPMLRHVFTLISE